MAEYRADVEMWSRLTPLKPAQQAEAIVFFLGKQKNPVKEKIMTSIGDQIKNNEKGLDVLLTYLESIYKKDDMADSFEKYCTFEKREKRRDEKIPEFIADWETLYAKTQKQGCTLTDMVLAFKLLKACKLSEMEVNLVLTGVDFGRGKDDKSMLKQVKESLKKFVGRSVITEQDKETVIKTEETYVTKEELTLMMKGFKGKRQRTRSKSQGDQPISSNTSYKGKKNPLGKDYKPLKCFKCKCECQEKCQCPCVYHLADKCTTKNANKPELSLFMRHNFPKSGVETVHFTREERSYGESGGSSEEIVLLADSLETLCLVCPEETSMLALIDCACPTTVAGQVWVSQFLGLLSPSDLDKVKLDSSSKIYKFGGGERRRSLGVATIPVNFAGMNVCIKTEVVDAEIPLLIGNSSLKKADAVMHFSSRTAEFFNKKVLLKETSSGHYSMDITPPKVQAGEENSTAGEENLTAIVTATCGSLSDADRKAVQEELCLMTRNLDRVGVKELTKTNVKKLHHYLGHAHVDKLRNLIQNAGLLNEDVREHLKQVEHECTSCRVNRNRNPKPAVQIPKASRHNQIVSVDLKEFDESETNRYILYLVDTFSRFTAGTFISNKMASTIGEAILYNWIKIFGRMDMLHSDRGREFVNDELTAICEYLDVKITATAGYSPNMNGCNERNHAVVDRMVEKIMFADPSIKPEVALSWALAAKNSLESYQGFSPSQIVFGSNPSLPAVYSAGPPGLEEESVSKAVANQINAMHLAREAFIECESDRVIKTALKRKLYKSSQEILPGEWIYFKNHRRWEGPVKITTKDGKLLYCIRSGRLLTINADHSVVVKCEEEVLPHNTDNRESQPQSDYTLDEDNNTDEHGGHLELDGGSHNRQEEEVARQEDDVGQEFHYHEGDAGQGMVTAERAHQTVSQDLQGSIAPTPSRSSVPTSTRVGKVPKCPKRFGESQTESWCKPCTKKKKCEKFPDIAPPQDILHENVEDEGQLMQEDQEGRAEGDPPQTQVPLGLGDVRSGDLLRFSDANSENRLVTVENRVGKAGGSNENWWSVTDSETNHTEPVNLEEVTNMERLLVDNTENVDVETFVTIIPRWRHGERTCVEAKQKELGQFDDFKVYKEVKDEGQPSDGR